MAETSSLAHLGPDRTLRIERPDGATVAADVFLPTRAPPERTAPLLILDGIGCAGWAFRRIIPIFRRATPVVFAYYRGHGKSPLPPRPWNLSVRDLAADAIATVDAADLGPVCAVGFSLGFSVALEMTRVAPSNVCGLVSIAGPAGRVLDHFQGTDVFREIVPIVHRAATLAHDLLLPIWRTVLPSKITRLIGLYTQVDPERLHEEDLEIYLHEMSRMDPELFLAMLEEAARYDPSDFLPRLDRPTLVIAGARDRFVPLSVLRNTAFSIPGARWEVVDEGTHALPAEHPTRIAEDVLAFARSACPNAQDR